MCLALQQVNYQLYAHANASFCWAAWHQTPQATRKVELQLIREATEQLQQACAGKTRATVGETGPCRRGHLMNEVIFRKKIIRDAQASDHTCATLDFTAPDSTQGTTG